MSQTNTETSDSIDPSLTNAFNRNSIDGNGALKALPMLGYK